MIDLKLVTILLSLTVALCNSQCSVPPGMKVRLNPTGFNFLKDEVLKLAENQLTKLKIPDIRGDSPLDYAFTEVSIDSFSIGALSFTPSPPNIVTAAVEDLQFSFSGNWFASKSIPITFFGFTTTIDLSDEGTFTASVNNVDVSQSVAVDYDENGKPTATPTACSANVGSSSLHLESTFADLLNFLLKIGAKKINDILSQQICPIIKGLIVSQATSVLEGIPGNFSFVASTGLSIEFVCTPTATEDSFDVFMSGRCFPNDNPNIIYDFAPNSIPSLTDTSQMASAAVSDYVINTLLYSMAENEFFTITFTSDQISENSDFDLNVLLLFIPALRPHGGRPMQIKGFVPFAPTAKIAPGELRLAGGYTGTLQVILENGTILDIFSLTAVITTLGDVVLSGRNLTASFSEMTVDVETEDNGLGSFFSNFFQSIIPTVLLPTLNKFGARGYEIQQFFGQIGLEKLALNLKQNAIEIGADIRFRNDASTTTGPY